MPSVHFPKNSPSPSSTALASAYPEYGTRLLATDSNRPASWSSSPATRSRSSRTTRKLAWAMVSVVRRRPGRPLALGHLLADALLGVRVGGARAAEEVADARQRLLDLVGTLLPAVEQGLELRGGRALPPGAHQVVDLAHGVDVGVVDRRGGRVELAGDAVQLLGGDLDVGHGGTPPSGW